MALYDDFAKVYDTIFPLNEVTLSFLKDHFSKGNIVDLACGTGNYSLGLAREGYCVYGIDLDDTMIAVARDKAGALEGVRFAVANMTDLAADHVYDGAFVIGNSLVHLLGEEVIESVLGKVYQSVKQDGAFVIQIINYDRILDCDVDALPTIERDGIVLKRRYSFDGSVIDFNTRLYMNDEVIVNTVNLWPLRSKRLRDMLERVGFSDIKMYGGFNYEPFERERSLPLIVTCVKL